MAKLGLKNVAAYFLETVNYEKAWHAQQCFAKCHLDFLSGKSKVNPRNVILLVEHQPVYTIGLRSKDYTKEDEARLRALGADFQRTNRGGLITFHGPGQLVAYPILNLKHFDLGVKSYVCQLEKTVISLCKSLNIEAQTSPDTGVWVNNNKLAAIGIHGRRYVTTHGIGLNCNTDLDWFSHIVPCGIEDKGLTSLSRELERDFTIFEAMPLFLDAFQEQFGCVVEMGQLNEDELIMNS